MKGGPAEAHAAQILEKNSVTQKLLRFLRCTEYEPLETFASSHLQAAQKKAALITPPTEKIIAKIIYLILVQLLVKCKVDQAAM